MTSHNCFDHQAFFAAVDLRRRDQQLSWPPLAAAIWEQSRALNEQRDDHPISPATIRKLADGTSCQHALFLLRWLDVPPETFIVVPQPGTVGVPLPPAHEATGMGLAMRITQALRRPAADFVYAAQW